MNYNRLSLSEVKSAFLDIARHTQSTFGSLDAHQLNWSADATRWSVAQCFEHLLTANGMTFGAIKNNLSRPPSAVQHIPVLPRVFGGLMIRSQAPDNTSKYKAPSVARPTTSEIPANILQRFIDQHVEAASWVETLDERQAALRIMVSPFLRVILYSVLDGLRLAVAHDHRHFQQAKRVMQSAEFPKS
jgi:hypothetical protein